MGTYGFEGVLAAWKTERLTTEQAVGQILQLLLELERRLAELEKSVRPLLPPASSRRRIAHRPVTHARLARSPARTPEQPAAPPRGESGGREEARHD